jgi:hypothetical protein
VGRPQSRAEPGSWRTRCLNPTVCPMLGSGLQGCLGEELVVDLSIPSLGQVTFTCLLFCHLVSLHLNSSATKNLYTLFETRQTDPFKPLGFTARKRIPGEVKQLSQGTEPHMVE